MRWERRDWENEYRSFVASNAFPASLDDLDYFSVDLFRTRSPVFKAYFELADDAIRDHPVTRFLRERDMLGYCETVSDSLDAQVKRIDIAVSNRTPDNMEALYRTLSQTAEAFPAMERDVRTLDRVMSAGDPEQSALCHLGLGWRGDAVSTVKCYFDAGKRDKARLPVTEIEPFRALAETAEKFLEAVGGRLWMIGADGGEHRKYKIYMRHFGASLRAATRFFDPELAARTHSLSQWLALHEEFSYMGTALCLDGRGEPSVNLYFMT